MSDPIEHQIRLALLDRLRTVRVGAGFHTDLGENVRDRRIVRDEVPEVNLPACATFAGNEVAKDGCMGGTYGSGLEIWVQCVVGPGPEDDLDLQCSRVKADVKRAVLTAPTVADVLSSSLDDLEWGGAEKNLDELAKVGLGVVNVLFIATFGWTPSSA